MSLKALFALFSFSYTHQLLLFPYTKKAIKIIKEKDKITPATTHKIQTRIEHLNDEIINHI